MNNFVTLFDLTHAKSEGWQIAPFAFIVFGIGLILILKPKLLPSTLQTRPLRIFAWFMFVFGIFIIWVSWSFRSHQEALINDANLGKYLIAEGKVSEIVLYRNTVKNFVVNNLKFESFANARFDNAGDLFSPKTIQEGEYVRIGYVQKSEANEIVKFEIAK